MRLLGIESLDSLLIEGSYSEREVNKSSRKIIRDFFADELESIEFRSDEHFLSIIRLCLQAEEYELVLRLSNTEVLHKHCSTTKIRNQIQLQRAYALVISGKSDASLDLLECLVSSIPSPTNELEADILEAKAHVLNSRGDKEKPLKIHQDIFQWREKNSTIEKAANSSLAICRLKFTLGERSNGLKILNKTIDSLRFDKSTTLVLAYAYLLGSQFLFECDRKAEALSYLEEAQRISAALNSVRGVANCEFLLAKHTDSPEKTLELVKSAEHKYESLGDTIHLKRVRDFMQSIKNQS